MTNLEQSTSPEDRRSDAEVSEAYDKFRAKIWWNRHMALGQPIQGRDAAARIETKYGLEDLQMDDFEFGLASGRMSALAWVMGAGWEESLDT